MKDYQREFLDFIVGNNVLRFGDFELKSGRNSPYFFNAGLFNTGAALVMLGRYYAQALQDANIEVDMVFGPSYKGIPIATALTMMMSERYGHNYPYAFNRKEAKDHGEGGMMVGAPLKGRVLIVDDVISAGTSVRESMNIITSQGAQPAAVLIALDRQEKGAGELSTIQEIQQHYGMPVISIITLADVVTYLKENGNAEATVQAIEYYRSLYGVE